MDESDQFQRFRKTFFQECDELISGIEALAPALIAGDGDARDGLFRAVHTIKGGAGMFGFQRLVAFAHAFEDVLDGLRAGRLALPEDGEGLLIKACDVLADLVDDARGGGAWPAGHETTTLDGLAALARSTATAGVTPASGAPANPHPRAVTIRFVPDEAIFRRGSDPLLILRELQGLGSLTVEVDLTRLPDFAELDPLACRLAWTLTLLTEAPVERIRQAFEFVAASATIDIALAPQPAPAPPVATAPGRPLSAIRVDLERIDRLVNHVGEIAAAHAMVVQNVPTDLQASHPLFWQSIAQLHTLVEGLRDNVMAIRAVPVRAAFARMPRLVRELGEATGKQVILEMAGEGTEIDKTVVDALGDPLLHMIRNAIDHGLETPADRLRAGKPATGRIHLSAEPRGSQVIIALSDDGRGFDCDRIREKASALGLVAPGIGLSDEEAIQMVFAPGFTTANDVSEISGRGVGMDVVKRDITKLGGRIAVHSVRGQGTRITIALPLTLAILSGMIILSCGRRYIVPISAIITCLEMRRAQPRELPGIGEILRVGERYVPLIRLSRVFGTARPAGTEEALVIIADDEDGNPIGIAADEIAGQQQVVVRSLRDAAGEVPGVSAASVLGDGSVALILALSGLAELHRQTGRSLRSAA